jgi:cystathionine gamma-synthase
MQINPGIETLAVHSGHPLDPGTNAVTPAIHLSTTFARQSDGSYQYPYDYIRCGNPGRESLEKCLCELEGGKGAAAVSSGSAATASVFLALEPGAHVVAPKDAYCGTGLLLSTVFSRWQLKFTFVDMTDLEQVQKAINIPNTQLVWIETPSNPLLKISDIEAIAEMAHKVGAKCACDNTWATPILQRPFELGADLVTHSFTKYLGGHGDAMGGIVVSKEDDEFFQRIRQIQIGVGIGNAPFDAWLTLRGIQTLSLRIKASSESASKIAQFLSQHPKVKRVYYPGLPEHPGASLAARQMSLAGGMVSFQVDNREEAFRVAGKFQVFTSATSLGITKSLVEIGALMESMNNLDTSGVETAIPDNLLRLSVGIEDVNTLLCDIEQALN